MIFHSSFRETPVLTQRLSIREPSILTPAWIICGKAPQIVASTNCSTPVVTAFRLIAIFSQNADLLGPWLCLGAIHVAALPHFVVLHSRLTLRWTRTHRTGICTAWVWHGWDPCRVTQLTGGQHAVSQSTASISRITFEEASRTLTLWITLESGNAGK